MYVIYTHTFNDNGNEIKNSDEQYLRKPPRGPNSKDVVLTREPAKALAFISAREAYDFADKYHELQRYRVGDRRWAGSLRKPFSPKGEETMNDFV